MSPPEDAVSRWLLQMRLSCDMDVAWSRLEGSNVPDNGSLRCCWRGFRQRRLWGRQGDNVGSVSHNGPHGGGGPIVCYRASP